MSTEFTPASGGDNSGVLSGASGSGGATTEVASPVTQPVTEQVAATPATPDYASVINGYGGEQGLKARDEFYNLFHGETFDDNAALDRLAEISPERYRAIMNNMFTYHGNDYRQVAIKEALADQAQKQEIVKQLGWDADKYNAYSKWLESPEGQAAQNPQMSALERELASIKQQNAQQQQQQVMQGREQQYNGFVNECSAPVRELVDKLNLPDTPQGKLDRSIMINAFKGLFGESPHQAKLGNIADLFARGESTLASQNAMQIRSAMQEVARPVFERLGKLLAAEAEVEQLRAQLGGKAITLPNGATQPAAQPAAPTSDKFIMQGMPGYGQFSDKEGLAAEVKQALAAKGIRF